MVNEQELMLEMERAREEQEKRERDAIERLKNTIDAFEQTATGGELYGGELSKQRALAIDAYSGKNIEPADEGRSQVVDWTVFETIQWILPSLLRIFAGGDDVVAFEPEGPEDEDVAEQESQYLNYRITQKNNWFLTCLTWMQDALLTKNAYVLVTNNERYTPEVDRYEGQTQEQVAMILQDDVEVVGQEQVVDQENLQPVTDEMGQPVIDPMTGQPAMQPTVTYNIEVKRVKAKKDLKFRVLPPERTKVADNTADFTLDECDYFEFWDEVTLSDLRKEGYDVPDDISDDWLTETEEGTARDEIYESNYELGRDSDVPDPAMREVIVRHIWVRHDTDQDGIAELQYVVRVGETILEVSPASQIPVACIVPFVYTHRHMGVSVADLVFDIQRIKTQLLRAGLDSLYQSVNPRHAISDKVNLDDMLVNRPGGIVRMMDGAVPGEGHVMPLQTEFVFPQAQQGLQHMDTLVEARVGVNRIFQGIDESAANDHNRIGQLSSMAAQRVEMIARLFANGFERLFKIAHELIIKSGHQEETVKLRGKWVNIDPRQWKSGRDMTVVAPFAAGNKDSLLQRLMIIAQYHEKALAGGLPIVTPDDAYELALEMAKAADLSGQKFFTDPQMIPPKEPGPDYTALALEIENKKADASISETQIDAEIDKYKFDRQIELDEYKAKLQSETQLAIAQIKEQASQNLEELRARLRKDV